MKIRWTKPTESGLGDRLYDLLFLTAYARILKADTLLVQWGKFDPKPIDTKHRAVDIKLENVLRFLRFPREIVYDNGQTKHDATFDSAIGGGGDYMALYEAHLKGHCSYPEFDQIICAAAKDFGFCPEIGAWLKEVPEHFVALHIRRGDKVRDGWHDGTFIATDELTRLDSLTLRAIDYFFDQGFCTFFVCGDEDAKKVPFVDYIKKKGGQVFDIPPMEKWQSTYYDLGTMTKAKRIATSQRFSTFSLFPALIGVGHCMNVFQMERHGLV